MGQTKSALWEGVSVSVIMLINQTKSRLTEQLRPWPRPVPNLYHIISRLHVKIQEVKLYVLALLCMKGPQAYKVPRQAHVFALFTVSTISFKVAVYTIKQLIMAWSGQ